MLKGFGARNFFSFKEGFNVSFSLPNAASNIPQKNGLSYIIGIKGANGSGKTNVIKALNYYSHFNKFPSKEFSYHDNVFETFFGNEQKSEFYFEFIDGEKTYLHEFSVQKGKVVSEEISRKEKRKTILVSRRGNKITHTLKSLKEISSVKIDSSRSLITVLESHKFKSKLSELKTFSELSSLVLTNVTSVGYSDINMGENYVSKKYYDDERFRALTLKILNIADPGICDIQIKKNKNEKGETIYFPVFYREHNNKRYETLLYQESNGNQKLYVISHLYALSVIIGGILALDEFDIHLHAMILPEILDFFDGGDNKLGAQFIFTAHNTEIIDNLGKYRTVLVNKEDNESYCYRLDDIPGNMIRNDRPISPLYLANKIGGTPFYGKISK